MCVRAPHPQHTHTHDMPMPLSTLGPHGLVFPHPLSAPFTPLGGPRSHKGCSCLRVFAQALPSTSSLNSPHGRFFLPLKCHLCPYQQLQSHTACIHVITHFSSHLSLDLTYLRCAYQLLPCPLRHTQTCMFDSKLQGGSNLSIFFRNYCQ